MIERTKNALKSIALKIFYAAPPKKIVPGVMLFSLLGVIVPLKFADAVLGIDKVVEIFSQVFEFIFTLPFTGLILGWKIVMSVAIMVLGFIPVFFSSLILNLVLSDQLIILPYTHGGIVDIGWLVSRDIANMLLVVIVIIIAVSTMLGNESRGIRNLLPKLVVIALLLNFTKVIAGVVVDFANIITNYLLSPITNVGTMFIDLFGQATPAWQLIGAFISLAKSFSGLNFGGIVQIINTVMREFSISAFLGDIVSTIAVILVAWMITLALLAFAFVFFFRYIAIWILVIVSPLAFVAMILPDTAKFARQWWDKFLHWAFIGIGPAFTLYLTALIIDLRNDSAAGVTGSLGIEAVVENGGILQKLLTPLYATFSELLFWIVIIFFMFTGLMMSLKMNSKMASLTVKWGKKALGAVTVAAANWGRERFGERISKVGERMQGSKAARAPIVGGLFRRAGSAVEGLRTIPEKQYKDTRAKYKNMSEASLGNILNNPRISFTEWRAAYDEMTERGKSVVNKFYSKDDSATGGMTVAEKEQRMQNMMNYAVNTNQHRDLAYEEQNLAWMFDKLDTDPTSFDQRVIVPEMQREIARINADPSLTPVQKAEMIRNEERGAVVRGFVRDLSPERKRKARKFDNVFQVQGIRDSTDVRIFDIATSQRNISEMISAYKELEKRKTPGITDALAQERAAFNIIKESRPSDITKFPDDFDQIEPGLKDAIHKAFDHPDNTRKLSLEYLTNWQRRFGSDDTVDLLSQLSDSAFYKLGKSRDIRERIFDQPLRDLWDALDATVTAGTWTP